MHANWIALWLFCIILVKIDGKIVTPKKKVCIVGAGPGGLSAIKQLTTWPEDFNPVAFEMNSEVGGQWVYTDKTGTDEHGLPVHSAVYKYLRTSGPKQVIVYPDYEDFYGENRSYVKHETVLKYVQNYTRHFNLLPYVKLNTLVEKVSPLLDNKWTVKTRNLITNERKLTVCDAVMICSGNFRKPNIPKIPGIETFPGRILHSHDFRRPEEFSGQRVVVLGASMSGTDIGLEISAFAQTVYLSHRHEKLKSELPANMIQVPGVIAANGSELILSDDSRITADSFVYCTGYLYDYPFLDTDSGIVVEKGKYVHPLYKHFINVERPTMAILNLPFPGSPLQLPYVQAYYFASVLRGKIQLPSRVEMLKDSELPPGKSISKAHYMEDDALDYYDELANISGALPLPSYYRPAYWLWLDEMTNNLWHYRENDFITHDDGVSVEVIPHRQ